MGHYTKKEIQLKVDEILVKTLGVGEDSVEPTATLKWDLMCDSIDAIEVSMQLERTFGVTITDYQIGEMQNGKVEDVYEIIYELTK